MKTKEEVKKENKSVKKILLSVGSIAILILAAITFVFIPGMAQAGNGGIPVFGSWNGEQVKYEQDSYLLNRFEAYLEQAKQYNQEISDYVYQYYLYQSFMDSINRLAFIDYTNSTGYTLSEIKVDRAMIPYFSENGKYSEKLYRSTPDNQKINLRNQITDDLIYTRYIMDYFSDEVFTQADDFADIAYGLKTSDAELAFINKMNSTSKSFDIVFFDTNSYPTEKAVEYANENPSLFNKYSFNAISVESESVAKKILSQINNAEITFEDALTEYSKNYYTTTDGVLKNKYEYLEYACQILDMPKVPELYIQWGYNINAFTVGSENPIIVLNSGLIDMCDDDEIMFIIGHELGHIKSNHMLYHMMASVINMAIESIPGGNLIAAPLQYALYYWNRMSEFTADRAGLLCCQNKDAAIRMFMKMAGMPLKEFNNVNYQSFIKQASEFKMLDEDGMSKLIKFISIANDSHPWTVMRAAELLNWMKQISL